VSGELDRRLGALADAVALADGRLDPERVSDARAVVERAGERLGLGLEETVVALAGPTGAGKSTLFNALSGAELAAASRRRPTTSAATAAVWGEGGAPLLDWLRVPRRHGVGDGELDGLVLLDLPDFDSVETSHRLEVERLIALVDLLVWVVDPQKYADAAWHDRYLRRLGAYGDSMVVALNQSDLLAPDALELCAADVRRLLAEDGLDGVPVLAVSAARGDGLDRLRSELAERVRAREAALARLAADLTTVSEALGAECGEPARRGIRREDRARLRTALEDAAGVPIVVRAVGAAHRRRGALAAGWPFLRWVRRLRPDPLRRLRLADRPQEEVHTSIAPPTAVQRSQVAAASRRLAAGAAGDLPPPWPSLVRSAATARDDELAERLDRAVAGADLHVRRPLWWRLAGPLQRLLAVAVVAGALWLLALAVLGYLRIEDVVPLPEVWSIPVPTALLLGGAAAGLLLAFVARLANGLGAARRARAAERSLRRRVEEVAAELVVEPVEAELAAHDRLCAALEAAGGAGRRRRARLPGTSVPA
jgi:ABC-type multidrug transport system fused ATPase/permease subunit